MISKILLKVSVSPPLDPKGGTTLACERGLGAPNSVAEVSTIKNAIMRGMSPSINDFEISKYMQEYFYVEFAT
jgi:hypothetical protein